MPRPSRAVRALRRWLAERYPNAPANLVGLAAEHIASSVGDMLRADQVVKVETDARGRPIRLRPVLSKPSVVEALRRIGRTTRKPNLYAKTWAELPADGIALIEQERGRPDWELTETIRGINGPIPSPEAVAPHIAAAIALASKGPLPKWREDRAVAVIAEWHERLTGEAPRQAYVAGSARRAGLFPAFLDDLEAFFTVQLGKPVRFGVQRSGRRMTRIFGTRSR